MDPIAPFGVPGRVVELLRAQRPLAPVGALQGLVDRGATEMMDERGQPQAPQREAVVRHAAGELERALEALDEVGAEDPPLEPRVVRPLGDPRGRDHARRERRVVRGGHLRREDVEDVEAPVPEAELDEREARRLRVPVRGLGVDPDLRLLRDPRGEDGEVLRRLVDPVVQARRGLDVAQGAIVPGGP